MTNPKTEFLKRQLEIRHSIREGEMCWQDLNDYRVLHGFRPLHNDSLRKGCLLLDEYDEAGLIKFDGTADANDYIQKSNTVSVSSTGEIDSEKKLPLTEEMLKDSKYLIEAHGFNPDEFEIVNAKSSFWGKVGGKDYFASKISIRPKTETLTIEFLEKWFDEKHTNNYKKPISCTQYDRDGEFLEIDLPDLHIGLKSTKSDTLEDYDIAEARRRFLTAIADILDRCNGRKFSTIYLCPLGDLIHFDNANGTTTKGTLQNCDARFADVFNAAVDVVMEAIDMLCTIAPVELMYVAGNHDKVLGYAVIQCIKKAYRWCDNVTVNATPTSRKIIKRGNVLVGLVHGDMNKNNMAEWIQSDFRKEFGDSKFCEIHSGHYHSQQTIEKSGLIIRSLPALCSSSPWEYDSGFNKSLKTLVSFVWHEDRGLRDMWFSTPNID